MHDPGSPDAADDIGHVTGHDIDDQEDANQSSVAVQEEHDRAIIIFAVFGCHPVPEPKVGRDLTGLAQAVEEEAENSVTERAISPDGYLQKDE
jgi:hypothetical protein